MRKFIVLLFIAACFFVSCTKVDDNTNNTTYKVGDTGPAGGIIFYDKGEYSDDWRYLEAAPNDLRVINEDPTVDSSIARYTHWTDTFAFGYFKSIKGSNLFINGTDTAIGSGKKNTRRIVEAMGIVAFNTEDSNDVTENYGAKLCDILSHRRGKEEYSDWFLPSKDELDLLYTNLHKNSLGNFTSSLYWSSSEADSASTAYIQDFSNGSQSAEQRKTEGRIRPVRAF